MASLKGDKTVEHPFSMAAPNERLALEQGGQDVELVDQNSPAPVEVRKRSKLRLASILIALYLAMFISALDQTITATAIPTITHDLNSASGYVWIGGAYMLSAAASGPIWAKISDIFGRKPILLAANVIFILASLLCAKAVSMKMLIVGRTLQGLGTGGMIIMIVISDLFSIRQRSLIIGIMEVVWIIAGGVGPILGGLLTQTLSWRWAFWINLPISSLTLVLLWISLDVHNPRTPMIDGLKAIDWFGSLSIVGLVLMVLLGLQFGGVTFPWQSPEVICLVVFGGLMSGFFIYSEKRLAKYPLMPLKLFTDRSNAGCLLLTFCHGLIYMSLEYYLPLFFQSARSLSPLHSGLLLAPLNTVSALSDIAMGLLIHRTGYYLPLIRIGTLLMLLGAGLFILFSPTTSLSIIVIIQIIFALGSGTLFQAPLIGLQAMVSQDDTATATSTFAFSRNIATCLAVVIGGVIFSNSMDIKVRTLSVAPISLGADATALLANGKAAANVMVFDSIADVGQRVAIREAYAWSVRNIWFFITGVASVAVGASWCIRKAELGKEHTETKTGLKKETLDPVS
ncbi:major facilitator superfamily domain-containing protein [Amylocarpus encephaloides]|uniref:Major facilitator superfamily domain-containing protein n=1 Tax=Amylocarpus encephaloides TaxID=45428 RepID=A0A9P7YJF4_9HELO|nr:major facilitator superfamily domain-containing protein [Amylocarpus encephaloides]